MDIKSRALLIFISLLTISSVGYTFYKTVILQDFQIIEDESSGEISVSDQN